MEYTTPATSFIARIAIRFSRLLIGLSLHYKHIGRIQLAKLVSSDGCKNQELS
jgi:hypothetical protein